MSQLMQDKIIQSAIEGLEHLPADIHFNSHKTWAELSTQLPLKKGSVKYWQYAAVFIVLILTTFFLLEHKSEQKQSISKSSQPYKKSSIEELKTIIPEKIQLREVVTHSSQMKKEPPVNTDSILKDIVITSVEVPTPIEATDPTTSTIQQVSETNQTAILTVQKASPKKYRIVHLNELTPFSISTEEAKMLSKNELKKIIPKTDLSETQDAVELPAKQFLFFKKTPLINHTITISDN
ncbi:hypothetical protein [Sediminibacterium goheungense]|nr:hypothetical protein [Sediminibacterium goheungense]